VPFRRLLLTGGLALLLLADAGARETASGEGAARNFRHVADGGIVGAPAVDRDGTVYCATDGGSLLKIGPQGEVVWARSTGGRPRLFLRTGDGALVVVFTGGGFEVYNPAGGKIAGAEAPRRGAAPSAVFETPEGRLLFAYPDGLCVVLTTRGRRLHVIPDTGPHSCLPAAGRDRIAFGAADGSVRVFRFSGRQEPGPSPAVSAVPAGLSAPGDPEDPGAAPPAALAWTGDGRLAVVREDGGFSLHPSRLGTPGETRLPFVAAGVFPVGEDRFFFPGTRGGLAYGSEGAVEVLEGPSRRIAGAVAGSGGLFFAFHETGELTAYDASGRRLFAVPLAGRPGGMSLSGDGRFLAVGGGDWVVNLFEFVRYGAEPEAPVPLRESGRGGDGEEEYREDPDYLYLLAEASSSRAPRKSAALGDLERRFREGDFGRSLPYAERLLRLLAEEPFARTGAPNYPDIRLRAIRLLGLLGSSRDMDFLADLLLRETDGAVLSGLLEAMGDLGVDPRGKGSGSVSILLDRSRVPPDSRTALGIVSALEGMVSYQGQLPPPAAAAAVRLLSSGKYPQALRERLLRLVRPVSPGER